MGSNVNLALSGGMGVGLSGGLDLDLDNIHIKELPVIFLNTDNKIDAKTDSKIDAKIDLGLDNIRIKELPRIDLQFGFREQRYHWPINLKFGLCLLGLELLCFDICGENMFIVEDLKRHKTEECA